MQVLTQQQRSMQQDENNLVLKPQRSLQDQRFQKQQSKLKPLLLKRFHRKKINNMPESLALDFSSSLQGTNKNQAVVQSEMRMRKITLRELDEMEKDMFILTNLKTDYRMSDRQWKVTEDVSDTYRRFQRCSFFDRQAIYHPKKPQSQEVIKKKNRRMSKASSISSEPPLLQSTFTVPTGNVSDYMESIVKTPKSKLSRFGITLSEKIRSKFLKDIKDYNTPSIRANIELSRINNDGLWIDQFGDLKGKLISIEAKQQNKYKRSICSRTYDPYLQYLAMTPVEKKMVRKAHNFDAISPKRVIS